MEKDNRSITLVIRLSSLGDVAILIPVLYSVASKNPDDKFILVTKKPLQPLFFNKPDNLEIFPMQTKGRHKGIWGLIRAIRDVSKIINQLKSKKSETKLNVADLHAVVRSVIVDFFFRLKGAKVVMIDKERQAKKALVRKKNKRLLPLKTSFRRYQEVFEKLGYDATHLLGVASRYVDLKTSVLACNKTETRQEPCRQSDVGGAYAERRGQGVRSIPKSLKNLLITSKRSFQRQQSLVFSADKRLFGLPLLIYHYHFCPFQSEKEIDNYRADNSV